MASWHPRRIPLDDATLERVGSLWAFIWAQKNADNKAARRSNRRDPRIWTAHCGVDCAGGVERELSRVEEVLRRRELRACDREDFAGL